MNRVLADFRDLPIFKDLNLEAVQWLVLMAASREPIRKSKHFFDLLGIVPGRVEKILRSLYEAKLITELSSNDQPVLLTKDGQDVVSRINATLADVAQEAGAGALRTIPEGLEPFGAAVKAMTLRIKKAGSRSAQASRR